MDWRRTPCGPSLVLLPPPSQWYSYCSVYCTALTDEELRNENVKHQIRQLNQHIVEK
jgi:hypothetical protein